MRTTFGCVGVRPGRLRRLGSDQVCPSSAELAAKMAAPVSVKASHVATTFPPGPAATSGCEARQSPSGLGSLQLLPASAERTAKTLPADPLLSVQTTAVIVVELVSADGANPPPTCGQP